MDRPELPHNDPSLQLSWTDEGNLKIVWNDGHISIFTAEQLRKLCPCAYCRVMPHNEKGELRIVLMPNLSIQYVEGVGNYGISFTFRDGHHYGIYPYAYLRQMCPCDTCRRDREAGA